jgi:ribonuclease P protein component
VNRRHRLRGRAAFLAVRAQRASASTPALRVGVAPNSAGVARVGFAIPRACGGAVERNRLRRRLREALRPQLADLAGLDVVVSVQRGATALAWADLRADAERCAQAARTRLRGPSERRGR